MNKAVITNLHIIICKTFRLAQYHEKISRTALNFQTALQMPFAKAWDINAQLTGLDRNYLQIIETLIQYQMFESDIVDGIPVFICHFLSPALRSIVHAANTAFLIFPIEQLLFVCNCSGQLTMMKLT